MDRLGCIHVSSRTPWSFPFRVPLQHPLVSSLVSRGNTPWKSADLGPKSAKSAKYPVQLVHTTLLLRRKTSYTQVFSRFPRFRLRFCPRPALRLTQGNSRVARMELQTPSGSLEISGNEKCWGPSGFHFKNPFFGFRKHGTGQ